MSIFNLIGGSKKRLVRSIALASLFPTGVIAGILCTEAWLAPGAAHAATPPALPRLSQLRSWQKSYDCGSSLVTLRQQGNSDRYTYESTNARGQTLVIRNGIGSGRGSASVYSFVNRDGTKFVVEDFRNGRATLTTSNYPSVDAATFDCTVVRNDGGSSGSNPPPALWSHTYQCGEYGVTLREEERNLYSYRTRDLYLRNGEKQNTGRSWLYSFFNSDYAYRVEDFWGGGSAKLTVTHYGRTILVRNCSK
jgi:hypothetical protein